MIVRWPAVGPPAWIDLDRPTDGEIAAIQREFDLRIPNRAELSEIEATSRVRVERDRLYLSAPLIAGTSERDWRVAPTGFVLGRDLLVTIRFDPLPSFETVREGVSGTVDAGEIFIRLIEEIVDRAADHLEHAAEVVDESGHAIFADPDTKGRRVSQDARRVREVMVRLGRASHRMGRVRYTFLSIARIVGFVVDKGRGWLGDGHAERLEAARHDIVSLDEFETSLSNRVQLLQDAAANFVSIEQNDVVRLLTIVSVVGVPPVLVVGVYGMNFRFMPELDWHYGYPFAIALVVASAVVPLLWFKLRGWL